jgi:hypothetical protein
VPRRAKTRKKPEIDEGDEPFRPTRRFTKRPPRDTRPSRPAWFALVLDLLRSYAAGTGHTRVPTQHREGGFHLGWMVVYLRGRHRLGLLSAERVRKLERLPGWSWDPVQDDFEKALAVLKRYAAREGHTDTPLSHREDGIRLGLLVANLRRRRSSVPHHRARALEAVPGWSWHRPSDDRRFHEVVGALRTFVERHGPNVPNRHRAAGVLLDRWAIFQREAYHDGRLSADRIRALENVPGWSWTPRQDRFEQGMRLLREFAAREGHCRVPQNRHLKTQFRLGLWVMGLRQAYRLGQLSPERIRRLERMRGWTWNTRSAEPPKRTRGRRRRG